MKDYALKRPEDGGRKVLRSSFTCSLCQFSWCRIPEYWNPRTHPFGNIISHIPNATLFSDVSSDEVTTTTAIVEVAKMMSK